MIVRAQHCGFAGRLPDAQPATVIDEQATLPPEPVDVEQSRAVHTPKRPLAVRELVMAWTSLAVVGTLVFAPHVRHGGFYVHDWSIDRDLAIGYWAPSLCGVLRHRCGPHLDELPRVSQHNFSPQGIRLVSTYRTRFAVTSSW
jgi:hypothetical protein